MSRIQLAVYAAIGVCLLLLGIRAVNSAGSEGQGGAGGGVRLAAQPVGGAGAAPATGEVVVHVAGEVADPGVFRLPAGSRVTDAVEKAGGVTGAGDPDAINLAARLADGQQIVVPGRVPGGTTASASEDGPISLGSADQADLETIDGIGPVTAADIIEFRDQQGGIASIEELDEVPGIGPATIDALSERLQP
ncbi:MAG: ComEA family DNA-binding protein [Solirubrobacterales bacterium]